MPTKHKWYTIDDNSPYSIDFSLSENKDLKNDAMAVFQLYSTENGDNEMIGNIYIDEKQLHQVIKDLQKVQRQLIKENKL